MKKNPDEAFLYYAKESKLNPEAIGQRVREVIEQFDLTFHSMGRLIHCSPALLEAVTTGRCLPNSMQLYYLHETLGVNLEWLLFGVSSTRSKILAGLYAMDDKDLFDIFTRLYAYINDGDRGHLDAHQQVSGVSHFAKYDMNVYRPLTDADEPDPDLQPYLDNHLSSDAVAELMNVSALARRHILHQLLVSPTLSADEEFIHHLIGADNS